LIHAPANYVGVYLQKGKGKWECISYHDSCWRSDGVGRFLFEVRDDLSFHFMALYKVMGTMDIVEKITDAICVVTLTEEQLAEFAKIRANKYK